MAATLIVTGYHDVFETMTINGKKAKLKKNKDGTRSCEIKDSSKPVEIIIYKTHNYLGKHWVLWAISFYLISIFGIFDIYNNKKCLTIDCRFNASISDNTTIQLKTLSFEDGGKFLQIESSSPIEEIVNQQFFDKVGQSRHKKMKKIKTGILFATPILIILLIILI